MIQALAMDVMLERDNNVVVYGQDVGYFGGVFRCTEGLQKSTAPRAFDAPISEGGIVGTAVGMGAYGLRPVVEIQFAGLLLPGQRPDRVGGGAPALPLGRATHLPHHHPHALRRRHLRRPDPQPEPRGHVHAGVRTAHGHAVQPVRRQGPADCLHRKRRPGDLPGAQAPVQRGLLTATTTSRSCPGPNTHGRSARGLLHRAAGQGCHLPPGSAAVTVLAYGTMVYVAKRLPPKAALTPR